MRCALEALEHSNAEDNRVCCLPKVCVPAILYIKLLCCFRGIGAWRWRTNQTEMEACHGISEWYSGMCALWTRYLALNFWKSPAMMPSCQQQEAVLVFAWKPMLVCLIRSCKIIVLLRLPAMRWRVSGGTVEEVQLHQWFGNKFGGNDWLQQPASPLHQVRHSNRMLLWTVYPVM